jgi:hypothetical protein
VLTAVVLVESERRVAGDVFFKNGHRARDWRRRVSIAEILFSGGNWENVYFWYGIFESWR